MLHTLPPFFWPHRTLLPPSGEAEFQLSSFAPFIQSTDSGASWFSAGERSCDLNTPPYRSACTQNALVPVTAGGGRSFYSISGNGPFWSGPSAQGPPPWVNFSSAWRATYTLAGDGTLHTSLSGEPLVFRGIPPGRAVSPACFTNGLDRSIFTYAVTELADGSAIAAVLLCDSPQVKQSWGTNLSAPSLVAFASDPGSSGRVWSYRGVIADAREMVPADTVRGLTAEADLAVLADGSLLAVMRVDGDCTCGMARVGPDQQPECGIYREYYQSRSDTAGRTWTRPAPMAGAGCVRPHLLSFGRGGMVLSGGRLCVENMTGLFLWLNADGLAGFSTQHHEEQQAKEQVWQRFSISWQHNQHWTGPAAYRFDDRVNASNLFESQAYTGLVRVGPRDFLVLYNKYWDELYDGMPGCNPSGDGLGCSTAFAMRVTIVGSSE